MRCVGRNIPDEVVPRPPTILPAVGVGNVEEFCVEVFEEPYVSPLNVVGCVVDLCGLESIAVLKITSRTR